jgi:hypothetical protein
VTLSEATTVQLRWSTLGAPVLTGAALQYISAFMCA